MIIKRTRDPSRGGNGIKLKIARFSEIMPTKFISGSTPSFLISYINANIPAGPTTSLGIWPVVVTSCPICKKLARIALVKFRVSFVP